MIYFEAIVERKVDKFILRSPKESSIIRARVVKDVKKLLGKIIKKTVPFGIHCAGKLSYNIIYELESYDAEGHYAVVPMKGTLFQILHAYRAGILCIRQEE